MPEYLKEERVEVRVPTEDLQRWRDAAEAERMTLSAWIREQCNQNAIMRELGESIVAKRRAGGAKKGGRS